MSTELKQLRSQARALVTKEAYKEASTLALDEYIEEFKTADGRTIDIEPLIDIIRVGVQKFHKGEPNKSDAWLAPRVHAALRLFRSEVAVLGMWEYLTVCVPQIRAYVIWRWGGENGEVNDLLRVWGRDRRNALARLWWSAELTRNGPDYSPTEDLFISQDAVNYLTDTLMFNNRPAAIAFTKIVKEVADSGGKKKNAVETAKSLNHILVTVMLDALVPDSGTDMEFYESWISEDVDQTVMFSSMPTGPNEARIPEEKISTALEMMKKI